MVIYELLFEWLFFKILFFQNHSISAQSSPFERSLTGPCLTAPSSPSPLSTSAQLQSITPAALPSPLPVRAFSGPRPSRRHPWFPAFLHLWDSCKCLTGAERSLLCRSWALPTWLAQGWVLWSFFDHQPYCLTSRTHPRPSLLIAELTSRLTPRPGSEPKSCHCSSTKLLQVGWV